MPERTYEIVIIVKKKKSHLKHTAAHLMLCDSNCTYTCEILTFLHQDKGGIMHLYKLYAVSKTKKKYNASWKMWFGLPAWRKNQLNIGLVFKNST